MLKKSSFNYMALCQRINHQNKIKIEHFLGILEKDTFVILPNTYTYRFIIVRMQHGYFWFNTIFENDQEWVVCIKNGNEVTEEEILFLEIEYLVLLEKAKSHYEQIKKFSNHLLNKELLPIKKVPLTLEESLKEIETFSPTVEVFEKFYSKENKMEIPVILGDVPWLSLYIVEFLDGIYCFTKEKDKERTLVFMKNAFDDFIFDMKLDNSMLRKINENLLLTENLIENESIIISICNELKEYMRLKMLFYNKKKME